MQKIVIVNKETLDKINSDSTYINLEKVSIVHTKLHREDVAEFVQDGNTLIIKLKNGEIITIENFFLKNEEGLVSDLVFEDDTCAFLWFDFTNGIASFKEISGLEALLPSASSGWGLTPWLIGGGVAALIGGLAGGSGGGSNSVMTPEPLLKNSANVQIEITPQGEIIVRFDPDVDSSSVSRDDILITDADGNPLKDKDGNIVTVILEPSTDGLTWTGKVPSNVNTEVKVSVPATDVEGNPTYKDKVGNPGTPSDETMAVDTLPPTVKIEITPQGEITLHFDPDVDPSTVTQEDITVLLTGKDGLPLYNKNGELINIILKPSENGLTWIGKVPSNLEGIVTVTISDKDSNGNPIYSDFSGNGGNLGYAQANIDTTPPTVIVDIDKIGNIIVAFDKDTDRNSVDPEKDIQVTDIYGNPITVQFTTLDGGYTWTGKVPEGMDGEVTVTVPEGSYTDIVGNGGIPDTDSEVVDVTPPQVNISITPQGEITVRFDPDVDPSTVSRGDILITDADGKPFTDVEGKPVEVVLTPSEDGLSWTGKIPPNVEQKVVITVPAKDDKGEPTYTDQAGNPGEAGTSNRDGDGKPDPAGNPVHVDTNVPTVVITYNAEEGNFNIIFSEVPYISKSVELKATDLKNILSATNNNKNIDLTSLIVENNNSTALAFKVIAKPIDVNKDIGITIPAGSYTDVVGNEGLGDDENHQPPRASNDYAAVAESGVIKNNVNMPGKSSFTENVLSNDEANTTVIALKYDNQETKVEGTNNPAYVKTKYGHIEIDALGKYTYTLDNYRVETQALKQGEKVTDVIHYIVRDENGLETEAELYVEITGTNDLPKITQNESAIIPVITGNSQDGSFSNSTITGGYSSAETVHKFNFNLNEDKDTTSTQVVVNLTLLDNSFKIKINGQSIHLKDVFQIENNALTTPTEVKLVFADGQYLSAGAPWNENVNGLPRFQIILTEGGVRFFATRNTKSTQLEEIFFKDVNDINQLTIPNFVKGNNTIEIINVDGVGVDAMKGYVSVTARGKFAISDIDSENLSQVIVSVKNSQIGDQFTPVLPQGISAIQSTDLNGNLIVTLKGIATKYDYEAALNSLMFKGSKAGLRDIEVKIYDESDAYSIIKGSLNYAGGNKFVTLTQTNINPITTEFNDDQLLFDLLKDDNLGGNGLSVANDFEIHTQDKINISQLLLEANEENLSDFVKVDYDADQNKAVISIDRDGTANKYQSQELLILTNQSTAITLEDLLQNNQIIF